jgi:hypothetical protein
VVIDPFDAYDKCLRINALDYYYKHKNVISISTVEHFNPDEYENRTSHDSFDFLNKINIESSAFLITWPIGYNKWLDDCVKLSNLPRIILKRINQQNEWVKTDPNNFDYIYNRWDLPIKTGYICGNAICVMTNLEEFIFPEQI